jgi:hypothetical protein
MRVLKLTLGKIIFLQIFLQFLFFSAKRLDPRSSVVCLCGIPRPDRLVMHPDSYLTCLRIAFFSSRRISLLFSLGFSRFFWYFWCAFLVISHKFSAYFVLLCLLSPLQVFCFVFCIIFNFI